MLSLANWKDEVQIVGWGDHVPACLFGTSKEGIAVIKRILSSAAAAALLSATAAVVLPAAASAGTPNSSYVPVGLNMSYAGILCFSQA